MTMMENERSREGYVRHKRETINEELVKAVPVTDDTLCDGVEEVDDRGIFTQDSPLESSCQLQSAHTITRERDKGQRDGNKSQQKEKKTKGEEEERDDEEEEDDETFLG